jgi:CRP/FNR family transcriptional regulator
MTSAAARVPMFLRPPVLPLGEPSDRIAASLALVRDCVPVTRRVLHAGESVYAVGDRFQWLHVVHAGAFKLVNVAADGREQVVGLQFKGDWLGFDGIASGRHGGSAVAMDTSEVWSVRYDDLLRASAREPDLARLLHCAMSREMARDREALMSLCTLPADARVAGFLQQWAVSLAERGLRTDQITLRMTRAEIGNHLGMKLETVSRALSRMERDGVIAFCGTGRRDIRIADAGALGHAAATLQ